MAATTSRALRGTCNKKEGLQRARDRKRVILYPDKYRARTVLVIELTKQHNDSSKKSERESATKEEGLQQAGDTKRDLFYWW